MTTEHEKNEKIMARWTRFVGWFTFLQVLINCANGYFVWQQVQEARTGTSLTQSTLRANLRREPFQLDTISNFWLVSPKWTNVGSTSAKDYRGWYQTKMVQFANTFYATANDCPVPRKPDPLPDVTEIVQGGSPQIDLSRIGFDEVERMLTSHVGLLIYGHIEYRDIYPNSPMHHHDYCVQVAPKSKTELAFVTLKESAD